MVQNTDPVQICLHLLKSGGLSWCQQVSDWLRYQLPASLELYAELCIICLPQLAQHQHKNLMPAKSSHQVLRLIWQTSHCVPMPKPEQIYINGCTVAPGVCLEPKLTEQHIHLHWVPPHVLPAAFSTPFLFSLSLEITDSVPIQLFAWLCIKLSCEMVKIKKKGKKAEFMGQFSKIQLMSHIWLTARPHTAGLAYPGAMLTAWVSGNISDWIYQYWSIREPQTVLVPSRT